MNKELCHCSGRMQKEFCVVHNSECSLSLTDEVMPRAGQCNGCTGLLAGSEHCKGTNMGCLCVCGGYEIKEEKLEALETYTLNDGEKINRLEI